MNKQIRKLNTYKKTKSDLQVCELLFELFPIQLSEICDIDYISNSKNDALYQFKDVVLHQGNIVFEFETDSPKAIRKFGSGSDMEGEYNFYYIFKEGEDYFLIQGIGAEYYDTDLSLFKPQ